MPTNRSMQRVTPTTDQNVKHTETYQQYGETFDDDDVDNKMSQFEKPFSEEEGTALTSAPTVSFGSDCDENHNTANKEMCHTETSADSFNGISCDSGIGMLPLVSYLNNVGSSTSSESETIRRNSQYPSRRLSSNRNLHCIHRPHTYFQGGSTPIVSAYEGGDNCSESCPAIEVEHNFEHQNNYSSSANYESSNSESCDSAEDDNKSNNEVGSFKYASGKKEEINSNAFSLWANAQDDIDSNNTCDDNGGRDD